MKIQSTAREGGRESPVDPFAAAVHTFTYIRRCDSLEVLEVLKGPFLIVLDTGLASRQGREARRSPQGREARRSPLRVALLPPPNKSLRPGGRALGGYSYCTFHIFTNTQAQRSTLVVISGPSAETFLLFTDPSRPSFSASPTSTSRSPTDAAVLPTPPPSPQTGEYHPDPAEVGLELVDEGEAQYAEAGAEGREDVAERRELMEGRRGRVLGGLVVTIRGGAQGRGGSARVWRGVGAWCGVVGGGRSEASEPWYRSVAARSHDDNCSQRLEQRRRGPLKVDSLPSCPPTRCSSSLLEGCTKLQIGTFTRRGGGLSSSRRTAIGFRSGEGVLILGAAAVEQSRVQLPHETLSSAHSTLPATTHATHVGPRSFSSVLLPALHQGKAHVPPSAAMASAPHPNKSPPKP